VLGEASDDESIVHVHIGANLQSQEKERLIMDNIDAATFNDTRAGIPVTRHRRFDVYPDVSKDMSV
jgi:predicted amidohydrolase